MTHVQKGAAILLKEKGFDLPCRQYFIANEEDVRNTHDNFPINCNKYDDMFSAPDIYQSTIWLRTKGVHVYVTCTYGEWDFSIENSVNGESLHDTYYTYKTHDLALEAGIVHALKHYVK